MLGFHRGCSSVPNLGFHRGGNNVSKLGFRRSDNGIQKLGFRRGCSSVPKLGFRRCCNGIPKLGFHGGPGFATAQTCDSWQVRTVGGATCNGVGRDRSDGGSRRCASGLLVVGLCLGSAKEWASVAADHVSR